MTLTVKIVQDNDVCESPRDWSNLGTMVCFYRKYKLGDKTDLYSRNFDDWDSMQTYLEKELNAVVVLPLYLYDHSGITMRTGPFSCPWDSGQVGFIYVTRETVLKEYSTKRITKKLLAKVTACLESEVKTYDQYLTGDVWGYVIEDSEGNHVDSCFGFFSREYCEQEAQSQLEYFTKQAA